jgi:hypothetical protein
MSDTEKQLRVLMTIAAGEPPRRITTETVRRRAVRRRMAASASAATAVVLAGSIGVAFAAVHRNAPGHHHPPSVSHAISVGVPRYYVVRSFNGRRDVTTVRATSTGAVRDRVGCPWRAKNVVQRFIVPANQAFFLVCERHARPPTAGPVLESRIYRFRVTAAGRVSGYVPVRGGSLSGLAVAGIAATPDGSELAVIVYPGAHSGPPVKIPTDIFVINTRTGTHAIWHAAKPVTGKIVYWPLWPQQISLTANGQDLAFFTAGQCFQRNSGPKCTFPPGSGPQIRVASPAAAGGQLNSARVLIRLSPVLRLSAASVMGNLISPDGSTVTLAIVGNLSGKPPLDSVYVVQLPSTGPRRPRFIFRKTFGSDAQFSFFSADPSGRHFLLGTGNLAQGLSGRIDHGKLTLLKPTADIVEFMVW